MRDPAAILEALPLIGGRLSVAIDEVIRLLKDDLPGVITLSNSTNGTAVQPFQDVRILPGDLDSVNLDEIVIEYATEYKVQGTQNYTGFTTLMIHSVDERIIAGRHIQNLSDRADLIAATLWECLGQWNNPDGLRVWSDLVRQERTGLPGEWKQYNGTTLTYLLVQNMNDGWA